MHGVLLVAYRRFLADRFGKAVADQVFPDDAHLDPRAVYPDGTFQNLIQAGAAAAGRQTDRLLREFGAHAIASFHELYPGTFPPEGARRFLANLEKNVHERLPTILPGAEPPALGITDLGAGQLRIIYRSSRNLCPMLAGMLEGTGVHYQTPLRYTEETCMRRGDPQCTFLVQVQQTLLPRGKTRPPR